MHANWNLVKTSARQAQVTQHVGGTLQQQLPGGLPGVPENARMDLKVSNIED